VWTALYGLMAIAAWLVWRTPKTGLWAASRLSGLNLFSIQLLLNAVWTPVFFHYHQLLAALVVILRLWVAILLTMVQFWKSDRFAAALLLPYLAWVGFAAALNYQIYRLIVIWFRLQGKKEGPHLTGLRSCSFNSSTLVGLCDFR